jgi:hypothetical protein
MIQARAALVKSPCFSFNLLYDFQKSEFQIHIRESQIRAKYILVNPFRKLGFGMNQTKLRLFTTLGSVMVLLLFASSVPAIFAVTMVSTTASPSVAPPNTTINFANTVSLDAVPTSAPPNTERLFYILVLQISTGDIFGCVAGSSICQGVFRSGATAGTGTCNIPFGGAATSATTSTTGGVTAASVCSGSDSTFWSSSVTEPSIGTCSNNPCHGAGDFAGLEAYCSGTPAASPGFVFPGTTGDTSQPGIYQVFSCWIDQSANAISSEGSFTIALGSGVPQFPLSLSSLLLVALLLPPIFLMGRRFRAVRSPI